MTERIRGLNVQANGELAEAFLDQQNHATWFRQRIPLVDIYAINPDEVDDLAEALLDFVANVISQIIDAGSERDAVNENEELLEALTKEIRGWTNQQEGD